MRNELYIAYDAGSDIWLVEKFDGRIEWHHDEFQGTYQECKNHADEQMLEACKSFEDNDYVIG